MRISVLGPLTIEGVASAPSPRDRIILQALALRSGQFVHPEQLAEVLWPDEVPPSWSKVVQGCISRLRRSLGASAIETTVDGYRLVAACDEIDIHEFERLVNRSRDLLVLGEPERADHAIRQALGLWRGPPFGELPEWDPARIERERLTELRLDAEELAVDAALRAGRHREVLAEARARAEQHPLREGRWALLARAEYQSGHQTDALRTLRRARELLAAEVGLEPGPELVALETSILQHDPSLDVTVRVGGLHRSCPFPGLLPYDLGDSELFFGRDDVVAACLHLLDEHGVAAVVGPSGTGKSSVVRAGIAAALVRSGHRVLVTTPGPRPADVVAQILRSDHDVLVVDQFDEALTTPDRAEAELLFDTVVGFAENGHVVMAVRADRVGALSTHPPLARLVERGLHLLGAMTAEELRSAIEGPAHQSGLLLEPGLVDLLVREVEGEPGALPLMSHALRRTWERREGRVLTVSGYRETGGLRGAVAQTAETFYATLSRQEQSIARDLMMRMVAPDPDGEPVRSQVPRRSITSGEAHGRVIELLVDSRLVTSDGTSIEIAHEALVRAWPRLRTWLDDDVEGQRILRHLTLASDSWSALGRPDSELYRGVRARAALEWRERTQPGLTPIEADFLDACASEAEREQEEVEARSNDQAHRNRQLRGLLGCASILLVIALLATAWAATSASTASEVAAAATTARARTLADLSRNLVGQDQSLSLLLAIEAYRLDDSRAARGAMLDASFERRLGRTSIATPSSGYIALDVDDGGTVAVAKRLDGQLDVVDLTTRQIRHHGLPSTPSPADGLDVHPDGSIAVSSGARTATGSGVVTVYDLVDGSVVAEIESDAEFTFVRLSPSGDELAISADGGAVDIFETAGWTRTATYESEIGGLISALQFSDSGDRLYISSFGAEGSGEPARLVVLDALTGEVVAGPVDTGQELVSSIAELPDREIALVGRSIERRHADDLGLVEEPFGFMEVDGLVTLAALPDGWLVAASPIDLQLFELGVGGEPTSPPDVIERGAPGIAFVAATGSLLTADIDGMVSTWTVTPRDGPGVPVDPVGPGQVASSADGSTLVVWEGGEGVRLHDGITLARRAELDLDPTVELLGVDLHSDRVVTLSCASEPEQCVGDVEVWDTATGVRLAGPTRVGDVWPGLHKGVVFAAAGTLVATGDTSGFVSFWDADTLDPIGARLHVAEHTALPGEEVWALTSIDVDDRSLVTAHDQLGQSITWDVTEPEPVLIGALENAFRMEFLSDGTLVTSSGRGALVLRDPFTLQPTAPVLPGTIPADSYDRSENGLMVASGDHGVQLWDLDGGEMLTGPLPAARSTISTDGSVLHLGAGPLGSVVRSVSLDGDDLVRGACRTAGRNLTIDEWNSMVGPDRAYRPTCPEWPSAATLAVD